MVLTVDSPRSPAILAAIAEAIEARKPAPSPSIDVPPEP